MNGEVKGFLGYIDQRAATPGVIEWTDVCTYACRSSWQVEAGIRCASQERKRQDTGMREKRAKLHCMENASHHHHASTRQGLGGRW